MIKFGTGGWRAIIGDEFTRANIQLLAKAILPKWRLGGHPVLRHRAAAAGVLRNAGTTGCGAGLPPDPGVFWNIKKAPEAPAFVQAPRQVLLVIVPAARSGCFGTR